MIITTDTPRALHLNWPAENSLPEGARAWATESEGATYLNTLPRAETPAPEDPILPVTRRQFLRALNQATPRVTFEALEDALPALGLTELALEDAYIELLNAQTFERGHSLVPLLQAVFQVDDAWCDALWRRAATF